MSAADYEPLFQAAGQQYGVDPNILKSLASVESGFNPTALNKETGASGLMQFIPATARAYGIDPTDPAQAIDAGAKMFRQNLDRFNGNVEHAVASHFAGPDQKQWGPKTDAYIAKVASVFNGLKSNAGFVTPTAPTSSPSSGGDDPIMAALSGKPAQPASAPAVADDPIMAALSGKPAAPAKPVQAPVAAAQPSLADDISHQLGLTLRAGVTGLTGLPNMVGDAANSLINMGTSTLNKYAGTNIPQLKMPSAATQDIMNNIGVAQPKNATERVVQSVASSMAGVKPSVSLGNTLSTSSAPVVSAVGNGLRAAPGMQILGAAGAGAGSSIAAENGGGTKAQLLAGLLGAMGGVTAGSGVTAIRNRLTAPSVQEQLAQALRDHANNTAPENALKPRIKLNVDGSTTPVDGAPSAQTLPTTYSAPSVPPVGGALPSGKQLANIDIMRRIGLEDQRPSAISGDKFTAGQEYETAKLNNETGAVARAQIQKEQDALKNYANRIVNDTGAQVGSPEMAGQNIRAPMQALSDHFDGVIKQIYSAADAKAGGAPGVRLDGLGNLLETNSVFAGKAENGALRRGIRAYMKEQGITDQGGMQPITVQTAEGLRQYLNSQWSPQNSGLIGKIKQALDFDVTKSAGNDIYGQARALHAQRANTLDNPNGIAKLLNIEGPNGINQAIPDEQVASKLLAMPTGQFKHIVDTLKSLPNELSGQGQQAIAEIKAAIARRIYAAGDSGGTQNGPSTWNASNVTRELNAQKSKMAVIFNRDELAKFQTLHDAGHILQTPSAYKGAAAQGYNYLQSGAIKAIPPAAAGIGALLGGPIGATVGGGLGAAASSVVKKGADASMAAKYAEALRNPRPQFSPR
jgi:hypothetical protein